MDDWIFKFDDYILNHYGRIGCAVVAFGMIALLALTLFLLSRLPEPKEIIVWSQCGSCRYKRKKDHTFVLLCRQYERPRWNQFKSPPCPKQCCGKGDIFMDGIENPSVFKRAELPPEVRKEYE